MFYLALITLSVLAVVYFAIKYICYFVIARSEVNCQNCGYPEHPHKSPYDLETPCSECGFTWGAAEKRNDLRRRLSALAVVLSLGIAIFSFVAMYRNVNLVDATPDWVLVRLAATEEAAGPPGILEHFFQLMRDEVAKRHDNGELSTQSLTLYIDRVLQRLAQNKVLIQSRQPWPHDLPLHLYLADCVHFAVPGKVAIQVVTDDGQPLLSKECWSGAGYFYHESFFIVPDEAIVAETVSLQIKVRDMSAGNALLTSYPIDVAIEYGPAWREMIEKVDDELEAFLRIDEVRRYTTRSGRVRTTIDINSWQLRRQEFAIGVRFELLRNDEILATTRYLHRSQTGSFGRSFEFIAMMYQGDGWRVLPDRLRIVHDPAIAVFDADRGRIWYGESVEVPVPFRRNE